MFYLTKHLTHFLRMETNIFFITLYFLSIGQGKSMLQKQISKLHMLTEMAV